MRRLPLVPTLLVLLMVPAMIALGFWQLQRAEWKEGLLGRLAANAEAPVIGAPAELAARKDELSFRQVRITCAATHIGAPTAARAASGASGYRQIARCDRAGGEPLLVSLGVASDPTLRPTAIPVSFTGWLVPREGSPAFLLVPDAPADARLAAEARPSLDTIANNHRGYAFQWFAFAAVLSLIYLIYIRRSA
ncbi:SURF1 family protein [Sphingoaurantiacus capsulatus]|uniref:SURF1-like protein n=1 Tax=Sphingoaurantiacus capsulatus TaxID=1771310 RepID=A0ABV7X8U1_9SPHN